MVSTGFAHLLLLSKHYNRTHLFEKKHRPGSSLKIRAKRQMSTWSKGPGYASSSKLVMLYLSAIPRTMRSISSSAWLFNVGN